MANRRAVLTDLPDEALKLVAEHLSCHSAACFAGAFTAPSATWRSSNCQHEPSAMGKAILTASFFDQNPFETLDFTKVCTNVAGLTGGELGAILKCIGESQVVKRLKLTGCIIITGRGLEPIRGSKVLEQVDLSMVKEHTSTDIDPKPMISEEVVVPILESVMDAESSSLKNIQMPSAWFGTRYKKEIVGLFFAKYESLLDSTCYACLRNECCPDRCENCDKRYCGDCNDIVQCGECGMDCCEGCVPKDWCSQCCCGYCKTCCKTWLSCCNSCIDCHGAKCTSCKQLVCNVCSPHCFNCNKYYCDTCHENGDYLRDCRCCTGDELLFCPNCLSNEIVEWHGHQIEKEDFCEDCMGFAMPALCKEITQLRKKVKIG